MIYPAGDAWHLIRNTFLVTPRNVNAGVILTVDKSDAESIAKDFQLVGLDVTANQFLGIAIVILGEKFGGSRAIVVLSKSPLGDKCSAVKVFDVRLRPLGQLGNHFRCRCFVHNKLVSPGRNQSAHFFNKKKHEYSSPDVNEGFGYGK